MVSEGIATEQIRFLQSTWMSLFPPIRTFDTNHSDTILGSHLKGTQTKS